MTAYSALRTELLRRVNCSNGKQLTSAVAGTYINNAIEDWATSVEPLWRNYGWYVTANQFRYALPSDWIKPKTLTWYQNGGGIPLTYMSPKDYQRAGYLNWQTASGNPTAYTVIDSELYISPTPSTTSNTSPLNGNHNTTVTTIAVDDGTQFHSQAGMVLINSEQIFHQGISTNDLTLCKRAQGGTTAASHTDNDTVKRLDLIANYFYVPAALSSDGDTPAIPQRWHKTLLHHAIANALYQLGREEEAETQLSIYEAKKMEAKREVRRVQRDEYFNIYSPYA